MRRLKTFWTFVYENSSSLRFQCCRSIQLWLGRQLTCIREQGLRADRLFSVELGLKCVDFGGQYKSTDGRAILRSGYFTSIDVLC